MRETTLSLLLGLTIIVLCGVICWAISPQPQSVPLQTFRQLQQQLVDLGYTEVEVDGKIGPITLRNWEKAICMKHGIVDYRKWVRK